MTVLAFPQRGGTKIPKQREPEPRRAPMTPFTLAINDDLNAEGVHARIWSCYLWLADGLTREQQIAAIRWGMDQFEFPCSTEPGDLRLV